MGSQAPIFSTADAATGATTMTNMPAQPAAPAQQPAAPAAGTSPQQVVKKKTPSPWAGFDKPAEQPPANGGAPAMTMNVPPPAAASGGPPAAGGQPTAAAYPNPGAQFGGNLWQAGSALGNFAGAGAQKVGGWLQGTRNPEEERKAMFALPQFAQMGM